MASRPIYQLHAKLRGYRPKIWRRFQVLDNITMVRLAYILMTMYIFIINLPFLASWTHIPTIHLKRYD